MESEPACDPEALRRLLRLGGEGLARQVVDSFLRTAPERIDALRDGRHAGDYRLVERLAHSLRGSAGNVGASKLFEIAGEIEQRAPHGETRRLDRLLDRVVEAYDHARVELVVELEALDE